MITQRIIQAEYSPNFQFLGFTSFQLHDMNHVLDPLLRHGDLYRLLDRTINILAPNDQQPIMNLQMDQSGSYRVPEANFMIMRQILDNENYTLGGPRRIRNITGVVIDFEIIPHGHYNITDAQMYIHCDTFPI